jgi:hypothetical protein
MTARTKKWILIAAIAAVGLLALAIWANHQLAIDACLDRGGRWNYEVDECEQ